MPGTTPYSSIVYRGGERAAILNDGCERGLQQMGERTEMANSARDRSPFFRRGVAVMVGVGLCMLAATLEPAFASGLVLSEFMAADVSSQDSGVIDDDGDSSDWIELCNDSDDVLNTAGWALTDDVGDLTKWRLPTMILQPREYLVLFASGKDRRDPLGELHTNFRLNALGEFLALVAPNGQIASRFDTAGPRFPAQEPHASYGLERPTDVEILVADGMQAAVFVPEDNSLESVWTAVEYDDTDWARGP